MLNDEFCIQNEELCIKNEEVCIENNEFCRAPPSRSVARAGAGKHKSSLSAALNVWSRI